MRCWVGVPRPASATFGLSLIEPREESCRIGQGLAAAVSPACVLTKTQLLKLREGQIRKGVAQQPRGESPENVTVSFSLFTPLGAIMPDSINLSGRALETYDRFKTTLPNGVTLREAQAQLTGLGGISVEEARGAQAFFDEFKAEFTPEDATVFASYLADIGPTRASIERDNAAAEADQARLNREMMAGLQANVAVPTLDGDSVIPDAFKTMVREALENGTAEAYDPRFLRSNPIFETNAAIVGPEPRIITTGVTNPYGGQESRDESTLAYSNVSVTPERIQKLMTEAQLRIVDLGIDRMAPADPVTGARRNVHLTEQRTGVWNGSLQDTYFEGHSMPAAAVGPDFAPWSGHYMLTTRGMMALPYTRMSDSKGSPFLTTSSLWHENANYKVLAVGHFTMQNGEINSIGLSGRMARGRRDGDLKIIDVVGALRALGLPVKDGVSLRDEG